MELIILKNGGSIQLQFNWCTLQAVQSISGLYYSLLVYGTYSHDTKLAQNTRSAAQANEQRKKTRTKYI